MKFRVCYIHHRHHIYPLTIYVLYVAALNEPGVQYQCDSCACDLTHTIRIKCANPICLQGEGIDLCPACFCAGKEFGRHKRGHAYRVIVRGNPSNVFNLDWLWLSQEMNSYPIFTEDWGADEWGHLVISMCTPQYLIAPQGIATANGNIQPRFWELEENCRACWYQDEGGSWRTL